MKEKTEVVSFPEDLDLANGVSNYNGVPSKQWKRWDNTGRYIFNQLFGWSVDSKVMTHPDTPDIPEDQWKTIRWNMAWLAADAYMNTVKRA